MENKSKTAKPCTVSKTRDSEKENLFELNVVFVVPYPISDGTDFLYVREAERGVFSLHSLPIFSIRGLPKHRDELTLLGLETRVRVSHPIGIYVREVGKDEKSISIAFAAKYIGGGIRVPGASRLFSCDSLSLGELEDNSKFFGEDYSIRPVKNFLDNISFPQDRIVYFPS